MTGQALAWVCLRALDSPHVLLVFYALTYGRLTRCASRHARSAGNAHPIGVSQAGLSQPTGPRTGASAGAAALAVRVHGPGRSGPTDKLRYTHISCVQYVARESDDVVPCRPMRQAPPWGLLGLVLNILPVAGVGLRAGCRDRRRILISRLTFGCLRAACPPNESCIAQGCRDPSSSVSNASLKQEDPPL